MKKLIVILLSVLCLTACSGKPEYANISNGNEVVFESPNGSFTKGDLYKMLKVSSKDAVKTDIVNKIAELKNIDLEQLRKDAEDYAQIYIDYGYESYITSYYGSLETFIKEYINSEILYELAYDYCLEKYDETVAMDRPVKMQFAYFDEKEAAEKTVEDFNGGAEFDVAAKENGYLYDIPMNIFLDSDTTLPLEVKEYINSTETLGISTIIPVTKSTQDANGNIAETTTYYLLNIDSKNAEEFKEDYIAKKQEEVDPEMLTNLLMSQYEIEYFDQDIYDMMMSEGE